MSKHGDIASGVDADSWAREKQLFNFQDFCELVRSIYTMDIGKH